MSDYHWQVVTQRLPRMLMAMANGAMLAVAGALTQALFKNPWQRQALLESRQELLSLQQRLF